MADSRLELLPTEVKLHLFSFLSRPDLSAIFSCSRTFREIDLDNDFWRRRIKNGFYLSCTGNHLKQKYWALTEELALEKKVFDSYVYALRQIFYMYINHDEIQQACKSLDHALERFSREEFLNWIAGKFHLEYKKSNVLTGLIHNAAKILAEPDYPLQQHLTAEFLTTQTFLLIALVKCNAKLSLNIFLNKMTTTEHDAILTKCGTRLLCHAIHIGYADMTEYLLTQNVNPNQYCDFHHEMGEPLHVIPMYLLFNLLCKKNRAVNKGKAIAQIINVMCEHGADMDLPGAYCDLNIPNIPTIRHKATTLLRAITNHFGRRFHRNKNSFALESLLTQIKEAPAVGYALR